MNPRVSVVIPFYNCPYIEQAIQSVLSQIYDSIELIVVDDGSTQHVERITPYLGHLHYLGKGNGGTASALNHGIRMASGDFIAWLSSDDLFYPEKIRNQVQFMIERNAMISFTSFHNINQAGEVTQIDVSPKFNNPVDLYRAFLHANPINGCTSMISRGLLYQIGLFNESLPYTHDLDLWYRIILNGIHIHFLDQPLTAYRWHDGMGTRKHWDAIKEEIGCTMARYRHPMERFVSQLVHF